MGASHHQHSIAKSKPLSGGDPRLYYSAFHIAPEKVKRVHPRANELLRLTEWYDENLRQDRHHRNRAFCLMVQKMERAACKPQFKSTVVLPLLHSYTKHLFALRVVS